jgi:hypothetical protein
MKIQIETILELDFVSKKKAIIEQLNQTIRELERKI